MRYVSGSSPLDHLRLPGWTRPPLLRMVIEHRNTTENATFGTQTYLIWVRFAFGVEFVSFSFSFMFLLILTPQTQEFEHDGQTNSPSGGFSIRKPISTKLTGELE